MHHREVGREGQARNTMGTWANGSSKPTIICPKRDKVNPLQVLVGMENKGVNRGDEPTPLAPPHPTIRQ